MNLEETRNQRIKDYIGKLVHVVVDRPIGYHHGDIVYPIDLAEPLGTDGIAAGTLVTEELSPIELFFN